MSGGRPPRSKKQLLCSAVLAKQTASRPAVKHSYVSGDTVIKWCCTQLQRLFSEIGFIYKMNGLNLLMLWGGWEPNQEDAFRILFTTQSWSSLSGQ